MSLEELQPHIELVGADIPEAMGASKSSVVFAIGHFGNFELYARVAQYLPGFKAATTYRGLRQASFNSLMQSLREQSQCRFFERRFDAGPLKAFMNEPPVLLGLLSDQHAGVHGLCLPFFGRDCSTSAAPAIFALRYHCTLRTGICYRVGLAKWRVEVGAQIATFADGKPRSTADIMLDVNRAFEAAVRRDPANWFWVHNRWKTTGKPGKPAGTAVPQTHADTAAALPQAQTRNT
jgi:KDO2-lipid IV(A) lauroyltransferase